MDRDVVIAAMLLSFVVAGVSDATSHGLDYRVLMAVGKGDDSFNSQKVSPSPTPDPSPKFNPMDSSQKPPTPKTTSLEIPPELGSSVSAQPPSGPESKDPQGPNGEHGKEDTASGSPTDATSKAMCGASSEKCEDADLIACLERESTELFLLVQNRGEDALTLNIAITSSVYTDVKTLQLAKNSADKISVSTNTTEASKLVLNAGKGDCNLHISPSVSNWDPFQRLPTYASRLTPIYGAYLLFFTMVIAGGTWACCKFGRKARRGDAVLPYQQLEMGTQPPRSSLAAAAANTADGWDQGWHDDWDEEAAAARVPAGNVSSSGLSSRSPNKDGWEWED